MKNQNVIYMEFGVMYDIIGEASKVLKQNNMYDQSREMIEKATMTYDYDDAYNVLNKYVELVEEKQKTQEEEEEFE